MSADKFLPHLLVLPEDDENRMLANGFRLWLEDNSFSTRRFQVMNLGNGWAKSAEYFNKNIAGGMLRLPQRHVLLLLDFDSDPQRRDLIRKKMFDGLTESEVDVLDERTFVLGAKPEPKDLKKALAMSCEEIGKALASECFEGRYETWSHPSLSHNKPDLENLKNTVRPFLLPGKAK